MMTAEASATSRARTRGPAMAQIRRTWLAFAAIGVGVIHLALVVGAPPVLGALVAALGVAEVSWGVATMVRDQLVTPRIAAAVAVAPVVAWSLVMIASTILGLPGLSSVLPLAPVAIALVFELYAAAAIAAHLRRSSDTGGAQPATPPVGRYLVGVGAGALLLGALVTPAIAATEAGRFAQPHSEHSDLGGRIPADHDSH
jgi:hypothetical protein